MKKMYSLIPCMALAIMSCADFPEIPYSERSKIYYGDDFTDPRDYKLYKTVIIGNQTWMAENLKYTVVDHSCYNELPENCAKYGPLYYWEIAIDACPDGWRLPRDEDWETLARSAGGRPVAGNKLKSKTDWAEDGNGTDVYGFNALPGGIVNSGYYRHDGLMAAWWSSTKAIARCIAYNGDEFWELTDPVEMLSVRCIKGAP